MRNPAQQVAGGVQCIDVDGDARNAYLTITSAFMFV